jgi:germination protein M
MRKINFFVFLLLLGLTLYGCSYLNREDASPAPPPGDKPDDLQLRETVFYFPDQEWQVVIPVRLAIPWQEGIARATLGCMTEGQVPDEILAVGLAPLLPVGTEILGLTIRDGLARIDFNRAFLDYEVEHERLLISGLVYTLTEFTTVNQVELLIEGKNPESLPGGTVTREPITRRCGLNLEVSDLVDEMDDLDSVLLYFLHSTGVETFFVPVTRIIPKMEDKVQVVMDELLKGTATGSRLFSAIPGQIEGNVTLQGETAVIRLTDDITVAGGGQVAADQIRDQIALTMTELTGIMEVQVLVSGGAPEFPAGVTFPDVFGRPKKWNEILPISTH